jgi:hypothetical protein
MKSNYLVWAQDIVDGACSLSAMKGYEDDWQLLEGISVQDEFPVDARFQMNLDYPKNVKLTDALHNIDMLIVASNRLCALLKDSNLPALEYLTIPIFNHKNRQLTEPYAIVNLLDPVDCLVVDACEPEWGMIVTTSIEYVKQLVIDESRINPDRLLFRPKLFNRVVLAHRKLAAQIDAMGCTGIRWIELADYK